MEVSVAVVQPLTRGPAEIAVFDSPADAENLASNLRGEGHDVELIHGIGVTPRGQTEPHRRWHLRLDLSVDCFDPVAEFAGEVPAVGGDQVRRCGDWKLDRETGVEAALGAVANLVPHPADRRAGG
jgi:hypothetical protein